MAQIHKGTSRYRDTPITDFYLDHWVNTEVPASPDDTLIELESKYHNRPELLSYDLYGTPRLWWVFAKRNMNELINPIDDFKSGMLLFTPTQSTIDRIIG